MLKADLCTGNDSPYAVIQSNIQLYCGLRSRVTTPAYGRSWSVTQELACYSGRVIEDVMFWSCGGNGPLHASVFCFPGADMLCLLLSCLFETCSLLCFVFETASCAPACGGPERLPFSACLLVLLLQIAGLRYNIVNLFLLDCFNFLEPPTQAATALLANRFLRGSAQELRLACRSGFRL